MPMRERGMLVILLLPVIIIPNISLFILRGTFTNEIFPQMAKSKFIPEQCEIFRDISLENPDSGTTFSHLIGHFGSIQSIVFSPDGRTVASGSTDGTIKLWDVITGDELPLNLTGHSKTVNSLAFSPDGTILASGSGDSYIYLWDVSTGEVIQNLSGHTKAVYSVVFSPDGATLISGSLDTTIKLWNVTSGEERQSMLEHPTPVFSVTISSNGEILASGGGNGIIYLWNATNGKKVRDLTESTDDIISVVFSPDGTILASGSAFGAIKLWDITSEGKLLSIQTELEEQLFSVAFSPNGKNLASGSENGIKLWNTTPSGGELLLISIEQGASVFSVSFSPDGTILASGGADSIIRLWNVVLKDEILTLFGHEESVLSVDFSPNGTFLTSSSADNTVKLWNVVTGQVVQNLTGHSDDVFTVTFSPNGTLLASGSADNTIKLWNVTTGQEVQNFTGHIEDIYSVVFSPNGTLLASGSADGSIKVWNVVTGELRQDLEGHASVVESIIFSPNGSLLASGSSAEKIIKLWDVNTGELWRSLPGHVSYVKTVTFSPNGTLLASGSLDGSIKLWSIITGEDQDLPGHDTSVRSVKFSPNGLILASAARDGTIKLWNMTTTDIIQTLIVNSAGIESIDFSPDGKLLASGNTNHTIYIWSVASIKFDIDVDGMMDSWELQNGLNPTYFFDKFDDNDNDGLINSLEFFLKTDPLDFDSDGDNMPDTWEYLGGLDPVVNNPKSDNDEDDLPAFYEYQMDLNPRVNDAARDKDNDTLTNLQEYMFGSWANQSDSDLDEMPDWWEFKYSDNNYGFNPRNGSDTTDDPDGDWVSNLDEFRGGSNPRDFWNVPLFALSAFLVIRIMILLIITALGIVTFMNHRKRTQNALVSRYKAPDYPTALKIHVSEYEDYTAFVQAKKDAKKLIELGNSAYFQENFPEALNHYNQALNVSERLDNPPLTAEAIFKVAWVQTEKETLTAASSVLTRFPKQSHKIPTVEAFDLMIQALVAETEKRWEAAEKSWTAALQTEGLSNEYQLLCEGALVKSEFRNWLVNPVESIEERMKSRLDEWQKASKNHQLSDMLCEAYLLHAKIALGSYQFNQVEEWLKLCKATAETAGLTIYLSKADSESEAFLQHKQRLFDLLEEEKALSEEDQIQVVQSYLRKVLEIVKEEDGKS